MELKGNLITLDFYVYDYKGRKQMQFLKSFFTTIPLEFFQFVKTFELQPLTNRENKTNSFYLITKTCSY